MAFMKHSLLKESEGYKNNNNPKALDIPWCGKSIAKQLYYQEQSILPKLMRRLRENWPGRHLILCLQWLPPTCDNYLLYSPSVWDMGQGGKAQAFSDQNIQIWLNFATTSIQSPKTIHNKMKGCFNKVLVQGCAHLFSFFPPEMYQFSFYPSI